MWSTPHRDVTLKTHWRSSHQEAWRMTSSYTSGAMRSISATFQVPCGYCGSKAKSSELHAKQCQVTYQVLVMRRLHQQGQLEELRQATTAVQPRQDKASPAYADFDVKSTPIGRALGLSATSRPTVPAATAYRNGVSQRPGRPTPSPGNRTQQVQWTSEASRVWPRRLILTNPSTHCYANASMVAVCFVWGRLGSVPEAFRMLYVMLRTSADLGVPVTHSATASSQATLAWLGV